MSAGFSRRRVGSAAVAIAALLLVQGIPGELAAQGPWATLLGTVHDQTGTAVADAEISVLTPSGVQSLRSDEHGAFAARGLLPGACAVEARKSGFRLETHGNVRLAAGQVVRVDIVLRPATVLERVDVVAAAPLVDATSHVARTVVPREMIERVPKGRDFTSVVAAVTPGTNHEHRSLGLQVDGASAAEHQFFVDGIATSQLDTGLSGKEALVDFLEEVQIRSSGFSAANRVTTGGVISAVTRSGTNEWRGGAGAYYDGSGLLAGATRRMLRLNPIDQSIAEYVTPPADRHHTWEPLFDVGGPLVRNRLWMFAGYSMRTSAISRPAVFAENGQSGAYDARTIDHNLYSSLTLSMGAGARGRLSGINERDRGGVDLPSVDSEGVSFENPALFPSRIRMDRGSQLVSASFDWTMRRDVSVSVSAGAFTAGASTKNAYTGFAREFGTSNIGLAGVPVELQHAAGYADNPRPFAALRDDFSRWVLDARAIVARRWLGEHTLTGGVQFERLANVYDVGEQSPTITLFWDRSTFDDAGEPVRGPYGFYRVSQRYRSGDVSDANLGLFVQDAWRPVRALTLDLGVRADRESLPSYRPGNPGLSFGLRDKIAPRLGFAWDPSARGVMRVYGGWGLFLDMTRLALPRLHFGAIRWEVSLMTLDTPNWSEIECAAIAAPGPACPGTLIRHQDRALAPNRPDSKGRPTVVDPDVRPFRTQELTIGVDRQIGGRVLAGARYVRKWLDRALEDTLVRTEAPEEQLFDGDLAYRIVNPGYGVAHRPLGEALRPMPRAERTYDAIELRLDRRLAGRWSLGGSYTFSALRGNYSGLIDTDQDVGVAAPNVEPGLDDMRVLFDSRGREITGRLATDRPHVFKVQGTVDIPGGTLIGANAFVASGTPLQRYVLAGPALAQLYYRNRGSDGRTRAVSAVDLLVQHRFRLGRDRALEIEATALNVFDRPTEVSRWMSRFALNEALVLFPLPDEQLLNGWDPEALAEEASFEADPQFGLPDLFQDPRSVRLAIRFRF